MPRRSWLSAGCTLLLAGSGSDPSHLGFRRLAFAIAIASASQDIAIDPTPLTCCRPGDQEPPSAHGSPATAPPWSSRAGLPSPSRLGSAGRLERLRHGSTCRLLVLTWKSPEPDVQPPPPRTLRDAVWLPLLGFSVVICALGSAFRRAVQILRSAPQSLTRPFLIYMVYSAGTPRIALATVSVAATIAGAFTAFSCTTLVVSRALAVDLRLLHSLERRIHSDSPCSGAESPGDYSATVF